MIEKLVSMASLLILLVLVIGLNPDIPLQISQGQVDQTDERNTSNQIRSPTHLDIESQTLKEELAMIKNLTTTFNATSDDTNNSEININESNSTIG